MITYHTIRLIHVDHIELHNTYKIPIKIIVLDFVGESQPTCCSANDIMKLRVVLEDQEPESQYPSINILSESNS